MKLRMVRSVTLALGLLVAATVIAMAHDRSRDAAHGIYSNMRADGGEYSGIELFILPSNVGDFVLVQNAEGWPQKPLLLAARVGGSRPADSNAIQFEHPEMGPFRGVISGDSLTGEFTRMKYQIALVRGRSIWQQ